ASGETLVWEKTGDTVRITSGGVLNDAEIPWGGTLILEDGAVLQGTVRLGTDVQVRGLVNATDAELELDISMRKEEYGTLLSNLAFVAAASLTVIVNPDQNKGVYVLAGYAQDFNGVITVKSTDGVNRGTITVEQELLDFDITRYTLMKTEKNELVFIVSSNITDEADYVLLYKNDRLVLAKESEFNLTISSEDEFDQIQVIDKGVAERIEIGNGGLAHIFAGARLLVSDQHENGRLRFDYAAGDSTVIKGFNQYGAFFVENNLLENVQGEVVNVTGNVLVRNYHGQNRLTTRDGVEVTGTGEGGDYYFYGTRIHDFTMQNANWCRFYDDTIVQNTEWNNCTVEMNQKVLFEHAVFNANVRLNGGTLSDVAFNSGVGVYGYISVESDLYFKQRPDYGWNGYFDMNGHTVTMEYTTRDEDDAAMISLDCFSEDTVFQLNLNQDQVIGKYAIATEARRGSGTATGVVDTFNISVDGNIIGTIDDKQASFVNGIYSYTMTYENDLNPVLYLTIDISENADETYNVLWYDTEKNFYHSASVTGLTIGPETYPQAVVRNNGVLGGSKLVSGGLLKVRKGGQVIGLDQEENGKLRFDYTEGDSTAVTGANQYGGFIVRNNVMENVYGENITVSGKVAMHNYHGIGTLNTQNGVSITGTFGGGWYNLFDTNITDFTLESGNDFNYYSGILANAVFNGGRVYLRGGTVSDSVFNTYVYLVGGTYSNIEINNGYSLSGNVFLAGDITLNCAGSFGWNTCINVNSHTVNVNYKDRTVTDGGMISISNFSEDVNFRMLFREDQKIGTYTLAYNAGSLVDFFLLNIGGVDTEELSFENTEMSYGNYHYTLAHNVENQLITLTIDISEDADETFNLYYWDTAEEEFFHAASVDGLLFDQEHYHDLVVRNHGVVTNSELNNGGLMTVKAGGQVIALEQREGGKLRFTYEEDDSTVIKGMNQYGAFFVENNLLENVYGENITVTGDIMVRNYHNANATLTINGGTATGRFEGGGTVNLNSATVYDLSGNDSRFNFNEGTTLRQSVINSESSVNNGVIRVEDTEFNSRVYLNGGTYSEVVVNGDWSVGGYISLDGDLTFRRNGWIDSSWWASNGIIGNGFTVNLDLTERSVIDSAMLNINKLYNTELRVVIDQLQPIGTYVLGSSASQIGQGDAKGVYDWDTNKWLFQGQTIGDLDNIITIYDNNGIELANCTVNGDTEYYGRHNYTVFVDNEGYLKLKVGWNNREGLTYAADDMEGNDTRAKATVISGSGKDVIPSLTIHSGTDVDWFKFELETPGRKSSYIGIDFKQWAGDLDINLYNSKGELIDYARSVTDNERLSLSGYAAGTYYLKVSGYNGNTNSYKLVYNLPEPIELEDDYEKGDDKSKAYFLKRLDEQEVITINASISRSDDQDYYMFILPKNRVRGLVSDVITLTYDDEFGDLDLYLYDQNGKALLASSTNTVGGQERVTLAGLKHGVYYAAVKSKDGSVGRYQLTFDISNDEVSPDKYENNDSMKNATKLYTLNGEKTLDGLSIHQYEKGNKVELDVDYFSFSILEKGSVDDYITLSCVPQLGDLDIEILNTDGDVVAYSRTAENDDTVSLKGLDVGEYYIRVYGYNNVTNNYTLSWHVTNSALIPSDPYEGKDTEPILIREDQTISGLTIAKVREEDETREDTFKIVLDYDAWKRSKIILTDYRSDWEDGLSYVIKDADGNVLMEGIDSEISLYGLKKGEYYLTLDTPNEDEYSEYSLIAQNLPDSDIAKDNTWSIFIYMAGDNNLEGCFLQELLYMQRAILPENVEVYVLLDRSEKYAVAERNWTDTRVGKIRHSNGGAVAVQWMYFDGADTDTYMNTHNLELRQEWDTGDVKTLEAFLDWGMKVGRADNYALIMKDHGTSLGYNCSDEGSGSIMAIKDIAELLKSDKYKDLSVVAFDQCLMGSDVVVTTMEGTVDYVVASEAVGYTPNWLVMYKVLLNSFETDMTPQEVSQKIVAACNCSGLLDLTMASFKSDENTLSSALEQFGELSKQFTYADWVALCKCYSKVHNYGDEICAYSDLGSILNLVKGYHETISSTLLDATNALYDTVMNTVIDSTMITPDVYGTGLAVFNPIYSDPMMSAYTYGGGSTLDYYATDIGKTAWGEFMYTLSKIADDCSSYIVDANGNLTFTSFTYYYEDGEIKSSYDLGAFNGDGVSFEGLYMDHSAYFNVTLEQAGIEGDAIVVTADNPNAEITIYLVQTLIPTEAQLFLGAEPYPAIRRISENGVLSLAGVDYDKNRAMNDYTLIITSTEETTYDLKFVGNWTNGVDFFDYSRTGSIDPLAAGNNSIDKATSLPNGNYGGLVTCAGDKDYYKILSVYANSIDVTVKGTGLVVKEYNAEGELLQTAVEEDGEYKLTVAKDNYVCVEGSADITANECNSYMLCISDAAQMYLKAELNAMLPDKPVVSSELKDNQVSISVDVNDGLEAFYSKDMNSWLKYDDGLVATENDRYYFKAVDTETKVESKYTSLRVVGIDHVAPTVDNVAADVTDVTNGDVTVTAEFVDDVALASALYKLGETGDWLEYDYENGVLVKENTTVFFKAVDVAGNESEVASYTVTNIDKTAPVKPVASADITDPTNTDVLVTAAFSDDSVVREYSLDGQSWKAYTGAVKFTENGSVSFRGADVAGNVSDVTTYEVTNIDKVAPVKPAASANVTAATNGDVLVTAVFSDDSVVREYSLDGQVWKNYTDSIPFTANGTVFFRGTDAAGNVSEVTNFLVSNIDKVSPVKPAASADITDPTNTDVSVSATFSADSVVKEYSLDGETWQAYTGAVKFTDNGSVYFRGTDEAGNISDVASYTVTNIDKVAPEAPAVSAHITAPTNTDVLVTAVFSDDSVVKEYSLDGQIWKTYADSVKFAENGSVSFRGTDAAGNVSDITSCTVGNIDKVAPEAPSASADVTTATNGDVLVSALFSADSAVKEYSLDGTTWAAYTDDGVKFTTNGSVFFRGTDAAGNVSDVTVYEVTNIDKVAPDAPTASADVTTATNQSVTVTAVFSSDSVVKEYSLDGETWQAYTQAITFSENGSVFFRGRDEAGNVSEIATYAVGNIDKVAPDAPIATADVTEITNGDVLVSATFSEDSVKKEYTIDGTNWKTYTAAVRFATNGSVSFRGTDAAGNVSETTSFTVNNIDKVAPDKPVATADITAPTNSTVNVSAIFNAQSAKKQYSLNGTDWSEYTGSITLTENGTVFFRSIDAAGNVSEVTPYEVTNIDKVAPDAPTASADITNATNQNVKVTAVFSEDTVDKEYSFDGQTWKPYTEAIVFSANGAVSFRGTDEAGNISEVASYTVTNIDNVASEAPSASADVTTATNGDVFVSAVFSEDSIVKEYSLDGQTWQAYTDAVKFTENGSVFFRSTDAAGNVSDVTNFLVSNIDKVAPEAPAVSADITAPTSTDVYVSATFSADSVVKEYSL
ncbi:MAG: pre-peptidase C-terminal domain-containing protein, partial [Lachnospiraceae bacterium]|nr:pre-peptidase C-terminal domain-containing protein [Lachnospiraceae bacterium]